MPITREDLLLAIENNIRNVKIANGFAIDVKYVSRQLTLLKNLPATTFPAIIIEDLGDISLNYWTGGVAEMIIEINLRMITKAEYRDNTTSLNLIDKEVIKSLAADQKLSNMVSLLKIENRKTENIDNTYPFVEVNRRITVNYTSTIASGL
jgi:hypothetical protein